MRNILTSGVAVLLLAIVAVSIAGCRRHPKDTTDEQPYVLPESHMDSEHPLKARFFQEPFRNLAGDMMQLDQLKGTPIVIVMFPSFLTEDGRRSLLGLEALQKAHQGRFRTVFVPVEDADTIRPAIVMDKEGMIFLFRAGDDGNLSLIDKYCDLFWDADIIAADFPNDPPEKHRTSPFYWVVDGSGVIREKLIDYSDARGVKLAELAEVLDALLGPIPQVDASTSSTSASGEDVKPGGVEEPQE